MTMPSLEEQQHYREVHEQGSAGLSYISGLRRVYRECLGHPATVVELGTWTGNSAFAWLAEDAKVWTIDSNQDNAAMLVEDAKRYGWTPNLVCLKADSIDYARQWKKPVDLLYVDTNHEYLQTRRELEAWLPHIRQGGFLVMDDVCGYPEVLKAFIYCHETFQCFDQFTVYSQPPYTPKNHGLLVARIK